MARETRARSSHGFWVVAAATMRDCPEDEVEAPALCAGMPVPPSAGAYWTTTTSSKTRGETWMPDSRNRSRRMEGGPSGRWRRLAQSGLPSGMAPAKRWT